MTQQLTAGAVPEWTVGDRLRKAREHAGLRADQFAEELGIARNTVGNYEKGRVAPRTIVLKAWAMRTGVSLDWLLHGKQEASDSHTSAAGSLVAAPGARSSTDRASDYGSEGSHFSPTARRRTVDLPVVVPDRRGRRFVTVQPIVAVLDDEIQAA